MRINETITVPAQTITKVKEVVCDICKTEKGYASSRNSAEVYWYQTDAHNTRETSVKLRVGNDWPEGGGGFEIAIDICPGCMQKHLIPWLQSEFGFDKKPSDYDY